MKSFTDLGARPDQDEREGEREAGGEGERGREGGRERGREGGERDSSTEQARDCAAPLH